MVKTDHTVDATGLSCPMPIVKARKAMNELEPGQVLEVIATDKGSKVDIQAWAKSIGHQYLGTTEEDNDIMKHYVRKANEKEDGKVEQYDKIVDNDTLKKKLEDKSIQLVDVRENAEYVFGHIPGAKSIPLGELESRLNELNKDEEIYVICRSGNRSEMACNMLKEKGFDKAFNVVPGMKDWTGPVEENN